MFSIFSRGVAISLFVKKKNRNEVCNVFYKDFYGTREEKEVRLMENDVEAVKWVDLDVQVFNCDFNKTKWGEGRFADNLNFFVPMEEAKAVKDYGDFLGNYGNIQ